MDRFVTKSYFFELTLLMMEDYDFILLKSCNSLN